MTTELDFLSWLDEQHGYYVDDDEVAEKFPDLEYRMIGVTKKYDPETGKTQTPKRDWRQAVTKGRVLD